MEYQDSSSTHKSIFGRAMTVIAATLLLSIAAGASSPPATAQIPGMPAIPKIPAFLPMMDAVPESDPLPIDGVWRISSLGKKIRIERGRAFAVDSWLHLFVLQVEPDMVVLQNFERTGPGRYTADDLPLQGKANFTLTRDGNIRVVVQGMFGPTSYTLTKRRVDDRNALEDEIAAMTGGGSSRDRDRDQDRDRDRDTNRDRDRDQDRDRDRDRAADRRDTSGGSLADCKKLGVDSNTGDVVCKD